MGKAFFCQNCKTRVGADSPVCPNCGRLFTAIKCPQCGFSGDESDFDHGCPQCGYLSAQTGNSRGGRHKSSWFGRLGTGGTVFLILLLLGVLGGLIWYYFFKI